MKEKLKLRAWSRFREHNVKVVAEMLKKAYSEEQIIEELLPYFDERKIHDYIETAKNLLRMEHKVVGYIEWLREKGGLKPGKRIRITYEDGVTLDAIFFDLSYDEGYAFPFLSFGTLDGKPGMINLAYVATIEVEQNGKGKA